jgi:hypothetical protein
MRQTRQTVQWRKQTSNDARKPFSAVPSCNCCASSFCLAFACLVFFCVLFSFSLSPLSFSLFRTWSELNCPCLRLTFFLSFFFLSFFLPFFLSFLVLHLIPSLVIVEVYCCSWSHSRIHSIRLLWMRDRAVPETSTCTTHNTHNRHTSKLSAGFKATNPASERPETHTLDRAAAAICLRFCVL